MKLVFFFGAANFTQHIFLFTAYVQKKEQNLFAFFLLDTLDFAGHTSEDLVLDQCHNAVMKQSRIKTESQESQVAEQQVIDHRSNVSQYNQYSNADLYGKKKFYCKIRLSIDIFRSVSMVVWSRVTVLGNEVTIRPVAIENEFENEFENELQQCTFLTKLTCTNGYVSRMSPGAVGH